MLKEQKIVQSTLEALSNGEKLQWRKSWNSLHVSGVTGKPYQGRNQLSTMIKSMQEQYGEKRWLTYKMAKKLGGSIKKGEQGLPLCYYNVYEKVVENKETGERETKGVPFLNIFYAFNLDQTTLAPEKVHDYEIETAGKAEEIIDNFLNNGGPKLETGPQPLYNIPTDTVRIPLMKDFVSPEAYYEVLFHEIVHSSGAEQRLNRVGINKNILSEDIYAMEELIAETGASFLCSEIGIDTEEVFENSKAYLLNRLKHIKNDPKKFMRASAEGRKAKDYILSFTKENG